METGVGGGDGEGVGAVEARAGCVGVAPVGSHHHAAVLGAAGDAVNDRITFGVERPDLAGDRSRALSGELDRRHRRCLVEQRAPDQ